MRKLKLYIETSGWNFVFAEDAPEKMAITNDFFKALKQGIYEIYVSDIVLLEIGKAPAHSINLEQGYWKKLEIVTPMEAMGDEIR